MRTCKARGFTLVEVLIAAGLASVLLVTATWAAISWLRQGAHQASTLVGLGNLDRVVAQVVDDARQARPRGNRPMLLKEEVLKAIDFPGSATQFAELERSMYQLVTRHPQSEDESRSGEYRKSWVKGPKGWTHNPWPLLFRKADDDLRPFDVPDLERVASTWYPGLEETFPTVSWPRGNNPSWTYTAIYRRNGWAIYTHYLQDTDSQTAGTLCRYAEDGPTRCLVRGGIEAFSARPIFEFASHPGNRDRGMELVKTALQVDVVAREPDDGNAIDARQVVLSRRVYPAWLQSTPHRQRWISR